MKRTIIISLFALAALTAGAQNNLAGKFTRPLSDVMNELAARFHVSFRYNVDTVGLKLPYADFRVRPYSLEESLTNICSYYDFKWWDQGNGEYKIKPYEYYRRHTDEGTKMIAYLNTLYGNKEQWEARRDSVKREVRKLLEIDKYMDSCVHTKAILSKIRRYDGYTVQNLCIETLPNEHVFASIYSPTKKGRHALIICPGGHFDEARYRKDQQQRMGSLARMGAICVDFDLYGWGESEHEVGYDNHHTDRAHVMQAVNGLVLLNYMLDKRHDDIDTKRIGVNGGSGGGTHTVLLSLIDDRFTASAPTVSLSSHFDGGCPCESGKPIQTAGGGTCNAELAAMFAPRPQVIISDGGDWTSTVPTLEFPYLQRVYGFYGAKDKVTNVHLPNEKHDFGPNKRNAVYDFFISVFGLDRKMLDESKVTIEAPKAMMTWPEKTIKK
jgi:hypothetical protein